jgi:hypothetical protein
MTLAIRHLALATAMLAAAAGGDAFGQAPAPASEPKSRANAPADQPKKSVRTGKERLGQKWTDEQRVNDCGVAAEMRGKQDRPDCPEPAR